MMNNKAQIQYFGAAVFIILLLTFGGIFIESQKRVSFQIQLQEQKILEDSSTILFYKIINNLDKKIEEVQVDFQIIDENLPYPKTKEIGIINKNNFDNGAFEISTSYLDPGEYIVRMDLSYYVPSKQEKKTESLTLKFEVIEKF